MENIYNLQPHTQKRVRKPQFSITIDAIVKMQLEQFCKVTGFNRSEAIEAILANYFKPMLSEVEKADGKEDIE